MTVVYQSTRIPVNFAKVDIGDQYTFLRDGALGGVTNIPYPVLGGPRNGQIATSGLISTIINNQHWLAMKDSPTVNFFEVAANGNNYPTPSAKAWTNSSKTIKLIMPPFCRWAEFHFLCTRDFGFGDENAMAYIQVASGVHTTLNTSIPWGEDLAASAKSGLSYYSAEWIHFAGVDLMESGGPTAVRIIEDSTDHGDWTDESVTITVSEGVNVYAAAYRVVPAFGLLQVQT